LIIIIGIWSVYNQSSLYLLIVIVICKMNSNWIHIANCYQKLNREISNWSLDKVLQRNSNRMIINCISYCCITKRFLSNFKVKLARFRLVLAKVTQKSFIKLNPFLLVGNDSNARFIISDVFLGFNADTNLLIFSLGQNNKKRA
jgi:hypothetical protein